MSSDAFSQMYWTDRQIDKTAMEKCKTKDDKMNGQMDRSSDEQCKVIENGSDCVNVGTERQK